MYHTRPGGRRDGEREGRELLHRAEIPVTICPEAHDNISRVPWRAGEAVPAHCSNDALLLLLQILGELCPSAVVPDEVGALCVTVQDLQQLEAQITKTWMGTYRVKALGKWAITSLVVALEMSLAR